MARYINEDDFVAWVKEHWCADCDNNNGLRCRVCWIDDVIDIVEEAPEADVVPKSEVERLEGALKAEERHNELTMEMAQKALANAKSEVAREIFAEIGEILYNHTNRAIELGRVACELALDSLGEEITELKKKYIPQDCRTCKHMLSCEPSLLGICDEYEEENKNGKENT